MKYSSQKPMKQIVIRDNLLELRGFKGVNFQVMFSSIFHFLIIRSSSVSFSAPFSIIRMRAGSVGGTEDSVCMFFFRNWT